MVFDSSKLKLHGDPQDRWKELRDADDFMYAVWDESDEAWRFPVQRFKKTRYLSLDDLKDLIRTCESTGDLLVKAKHERDAPKYWINRESEDGYPDTTWLHVQYEDGKRYDVEFDTIMYPIAILYGRHPTVKAFRDSRGYWKFIMCGLKNADKEHWADIIWFAQRIDRIFAEEGLGTPLSRWPEALKELDDQEGIH